MTEATARPIGDRPARHPWLALVASVGICLLVGGGIGGIFTAQSVGSDWYARLVKPAWNPPRWVFSPVWTTLYVLMGTAAWLVWRARRWRRARAATVLFFVQLGLNALWSALFFGLRSPGWALLELLCLWAAVLATTVLFWRIRPLAGVLLLPYLAWTTFAGFLNYAIWRMNS